MPSITETYMAGVVVKRIIDNEDGTKIVSVYSEDGELQSEETIEDGVVVNNIVETVSPEEAVLALLANIPPEAVASAVSAGALLVAKAGDLWDALLKVADSNTAKPLLDKIVDVALTVALEQQS